MGCAPRPLRTLLSLCAARCVLEGTAMVLKRSSQWQRSTCLPRVVHHDGPWLLREALVDAQGLWATVTQLGE